jgi:glutamine synthetase
MSLSVNSKVILEYVWIDAEGNTRSKIRIENDFSNNEIQIEKLPWWSFDGSSTKQAEGKLSDVLLKPVRSYINTFFKNVNTNAYFILCECYNKDKTPHITNTRIKCIDTYEKYKKHEPMFGIEQEYVLSENIKTNATECFLKGNQEGRSYCAVGGDRSFGRQLSNDHLETCINSNIDICGSNAEVTPLQWEYQIGVCDPLKISDDLIMSRYLLQRLSEKYNYSVSFHPKPFQGANGSGGHTNFSTKQMRNQINGLSYIKKACELLRPSHLDHMKVYGIDNDMRMTGDCETSSYNNFSWGEGNRGSSIRIPLPVVENGYGYLEDRRPGANLDPYLVTEILIRNVCEGFELEGF